MLCQFSFQLADLIGELEQDPEHEASFAVPAARVRAKIDGYVVMRPGEMRRWLEHAGIAPPRRLILPRETA